MPPPTNERQTKSLSSKETRKTAKKSRLYYQWTTTKPKSYVWFKHVKHIFDKLFFRSQRKKKTEKNYIGGSPKAQNIHKSPSTTTEGLGARWSIHFWDQVSISRQSSPRTWALCACRERPSIWREERAKCWERVVNQLLASNHSKRVRPQTDKASGQSLPLAFSSGPEVFSI